MCIDLKKNMELDKSIDQQEKINQDSESGATISKIAFTRNIIRKKYKEAFMNRIVNEQEIKRHANIETQTYDLQSDQNRSQTKTKNKKHQRTTTTTDICSKQDPNELCMRLRILMSASMAGNAHNACEIREIISKLRELEIIV